MPTASIEKLPPRRRRQEDARPALELPLAPPRPLEQEAVRPEREEEGERGVVLIDFYI